MELEFKEIKKNLKAKDESFILDFIKRIEKREYTEELNDEEERILRQNDLVCVFGASDDLIEFRGAFYEEFGASDNSLFFDKNFNIISTKKQFLLDIDVNNNDDLGLIYLDDIVINLSNEITCIFGKDGITWQYKTNFPSYEFDVMEDGEIYCKGIIFSLHDLK